MISKEKVGDMIKETNVCDVCGKAHTFDVGNRAIKASKTDLAWFDVEVGIGNRECLPRVNTCGTKCAAEVLPKQIDEALAHFAKNADLSSVRIEIRKRSLPSK